MFFYHVISKIPGGFKRECALTTVVGYLASVLALVFPQMSRPGARIVALSAVEGPFSGVGALVHFQVASFSA